MFGQERESCEGLEWLVRMREGGDKSTDRVPSDLEDPPETRQPDSAVTLFTGSLFPPVSFKFLSLKKDTTRGYGQPGWGFGVGVTQG